jgi:hypothetical protein
VQIEQAMLVLGKSLTFEEGHLEDLVDTAYGSPRLFPVLALVYAGANVNKNTYHVDHIFPASRFTRARLRALTRTDEGGHPIIGPDGKPERALTDDQVEAMMERFDLLPNLQLLEGHANISKQATLPAEWWAQAEPNSDVRHAVFASQDMTGLPPTLAGFLDFFDTRRQRLETKLRTMLGVKPVQDSGTDAEEHVDATALAVN